MARTKTAILGRARRKLDRCPGLAYTVSARGVDVPAPGDSGFPIRIRVRRRAYRVYLGGWWREFDRDDDALDCLDFALSKGCRLLVEYRGNTEVAWTVESREFGMWRAHHRSARRLVPFWKPKRTAYLQNDVTVLYPGEVKDEAPANAEGGTRRAELGAEFGVRNAEVARNRCAGRLLGSGSRALST